MKKNNKSTDSYDYNKEREIIDTIRKAFKPLKKEMDKYPNTFSIYERENGYNIMIDVDFLRQHLEKED